MDEVKQLSEVLQKHLGASLRKPTADMTKLAKSAASSVIDEEMRILNATPDGVLGSPFAPEKIQETTEYLTLEVLGQFGCEIVDGDGYRFSAWMNNNKDRFHHGLDFSDILKSDEPLEAVRNCMENDKKSKKRCRALDTICDKAPNKLYSTRGDVVAAIRGKITKTKLIHNLTGNPTRFVHDWPWADTDHSEVMTPQLLAEKWIEDLVRLSDKKLLDPELNVIRLALVDLANHKTKKSDVLKVVAEFVDVKTIQYVWPWNDHCHTEEAPEDLKRLFQ